MLVNNGIKLRTAVNEGSPEEAHSNIPHYKLVTYIADKLQGWQPMDDIEDWEKYVFSIIKKLSPVLGYEPKHSNSWGTPMPLTLQSPEEFLNIPDDVVKSEMLSFIETPEMSNLIAYHIDLAIELSPDSTVLSESLNAWSYDSIQDARQALNV